MIDVFIPTKNSQDTILAVLQALRRVQAPVRRIINLDVSSSDHTVGIMEAFCHQAGWEFFSVNNEPGVGLARFLANELVETELYLSLDSDVILSEGYIQRLLEIMEDDPGLIFASGFVLFGDLGGPVASIYQWRRAKKGSQPCLGASIIRRSLADFDVIKDVAWGEDSAFEAHMTLTGGRCYLDYDLTAYHPRGLWEDLIHMALWGGGAKTLGRTWTLETGRFFVKSLAGLSVAWATQDWRVAVWSPIRELSHLIGFIKTPRSSMRLTLAQEFEIIRRRKNSPSQVAEGHTLSP